MKRQERSWPLRVLVVWRQNMEAVDQARRCLQGERILACSLEGLPRQESASRSDV